MSEDDTQFAGITPRSTPRSSGSSISPSTSSSSSGSAKSAVSECLGAWLNYLQILNNLCASGYRLSQCVTQLETFANEVQQAGAPSQTSYQLITAWDELAKATSIATATVKSHMVSILQDFITQPLNTFEQESDIQKAREHNHCVVHECFQTLMNLQHQFSVASCDFFAQPCYQNPEHAAICHQEIRSQTPSPAGIPKTEITRSDRFGGSGSTQSSDHGTAYDQIRGPSPIQGLGHLDHIRGPLPPPGHLLTMKTPFYRGSRSPLNFPLFPASNGRRWSETAAVQTAAAEDAENQARRWSMPWEHKTDKQNTRVPISKLAVPMNSSGKASCGSTPDSSVDGLTEAIQLLSCKPIPRPMPPPMQPPQPPPPFIEEPQPPGGMYGIWSARSQPHYMQMRYMREQDRSFDENAPP